MRTIEELKRDYQATLWDINALPGNLLYGVYEGYIKLPDCGACHVIWGYNEDGWEHVSVSPKKKDVLPTWNDMARLKEIFFCPEEEAYQIMPKKSEYVNFKENCLHIYRPANGRLLREII